MIDLRHGDCLDILSTLESESIDLVVTDPPYRVISGGTNVGKEGQHRPSGMLSANTSKIFEHNDIDVEEYMPLLFSVLKPNSQAYIMTNTLNLERMMRSARETGFQLHNVLVWVKDNCTPNRWYMKNVEYTLFLRKGKAKTINNVGSLTAHKVNNVKGKVHPTEKPFELMQMYVENSSQEGDVVLDPFMGGGSTGIACVNADRNFIGIEKDDEFFKIAKDRIENFKVATDIEDLFE